MIQSRILASVKESIQAMQQLELPSSLEFITQAAEMIAACFQQGGKLIIAGNGGSLCDAAHFAEELTGQFRGKRRALPAIALTEAGHLTCTANDFGFDWVFARGVEAYGKPEDVFIGLTTSGNSPNIVQAFKVAKGLGLKTIAFLGKEGGVLKGTAHLELLIRGFKTSDRVQEVHMSAIHIIIEMVEIHLFGATDSVASSGEHVLARVVYSS